MLFPYVAYNNILARSSGTSDTVKVRLKSRVAYHIIILVYCIGAQRLKRSVVQQLVVCLLD